MKVVVRCVLLNNAVYEKHFHKISIGPITSSVYESLSFLLSPRYILYTSTSPFRLLLLLLPHLLFPESGRILLLPKVWLRWYWFTLIRLYYFFSWFAHWKDVCHYLYRYQMGSHLGLSIIRMGGYRAFITVMISKLPFACEGYNFE